MIEVTDEIALDDGEIRIDFIRASGPGGQKVNKASTAVQLRFDVKNSPALPEEVRQRLLVLGGKRISDEGVLVIEASRFRIQERNRQDALERLADLVRKAAKQTRKRVPTEPTAESKRLRLEQKRKRSEIKHLRKEIPAQED